MTQHCMKSDSLITNATFNHSRVHILQLLQQPLVLPAHHFLVAQYHIPRIKQLRVLRPQRLVLRHIQPHQIADLRHLQLGHALQVHLRRIRDDAALGGTDQLLGAVLERLRVQVQGALQVLVLQLQRVHLALQTQDERLARIHHDDRLGADAFGARRIAQRVQRLADVGARRRDAGNHQGDAVAGQTVGQQFGQLAVAVGNVAVALLRVAQ